MKRVLGVMLLFFCWMNSFSQGRNNLWMLGYYPDPLGKANIEFSSGSPVITSVNRPIKLSLTFANITDTNGDLLFYTNGAVVANALDSVMPNGDSLSPATYTFSGAWQFFGFPIPQASLIIPDPGDSSKYYLFHSSIDVLQNGAQRPLHLYYSIVNMVADNGHGDVIRKLTF